MYFLYIYLNWQWILLLFVLMYHYEVHLHSLMTIVWNDWFPVTSLSLCNCSTNNDTIWKVGKGGKGGKVVCCHTKLFIV